MFIFARCLRSSAAVTPAKYELDIVKVTIVFIIPKNWENNGTEKIGLVTPTPDYMSLSFIWNGESSSVSNLCEFKSCNLSISRNHCKTHFIEILSFCINTFFMYCFFIMMASSTGTFSALLASCAGNLPVIGEKTLRKALTFSMIFA